MIIFLKNNIKTGFSGMYNKRSISHHSLQGWIALIIYWTTFILVSFIVFQKARLIYPDYIIANLSIGIGGGILVIYPFTIIRDGWYKMSTNWVGWLILASLSYVLARIIEI
jgi:hypothetical protein